MQKPTEKSIEAATSLKGALVGVNRMINRGTKICSIIAGSGVLLLFQLQHLLFHFCPAIYFCTEPPKF